MPIDLSSQIGSAGDAAVGGGHHDARELGVDRRRVADRDVLAGRRNDARAVGHADVDRALADERDQVRVDLVLEGHLEPGVAVVALLLRAIELSELDARDVAQADGQRRERRRRRCLRSRRSAATSAITRTAPRAGIRRTFTSSCPPGRVRRRRRRDRAARRWPRWSAEWRTASGVSKSEPRARLISTPRPRSAPAHSPTMAPMTASVTPTRMPPRICGSGRRQLEVAEDLPARRAQAAAELEQPRVDRADADHRRHGDREEDDQRADDDLRLEPRARARARAAARAQGWASPGPRRGRARAAARPCASGRADSRPPRPGRHRPRSPSAISVRVASTCGVMVPSTQAVEKRLATSSGAGRMNVG